MKILKREFKAWLESKRPGEIVGEINSFTDCPLCRFMREVHGCQRPLVTGWKFTTTRSEEDTYSWEANVELPPWASKFSRSGCHGDRFLRYTARKALEILEARS